MFIHVIAYDEHVYQSIARAMINSGMSDGNSVDKTMRDVVSHPANNGIFGKLIFDNEFDPIFYEMCNEPIYHSSQDPDGIAYDFYQMFKALDK